MQGLFDAVANVTHAYASTVRMVVIGAVVLGAIIMGMFVYAAPAVVEDVGQRAERISEKAIEAAREETRAHALAQEGWGYSDNPASSADAFASEPSGYSDGDSYDESFGEPAEGWGEAAE